MRLWIGKTLSLIPKPIRWASIIVVAVGLLLPGLMLSVSDVDTVLDARVPSAPISLSLILLGTVSLLMGVLGNVIADQFIRWLRTRLPAASRFLSNDFQTRLIGLSLGMIIRRFAEDVPDRKHASTLTQLATKLEAKWQWIVKAPSTLAQLPLLSDRVLAEIVTRPSDSTLAIENWRHLLRVANDGTDPSVPLHVLDRLADVLRTQYRYAVRIALENDFAEGGQASMGMLLDLSAALLERVRPSEMRLDGGSAEHELREALQSAVADFRWETRQLARRARRHAQAVETRLQSLHVWLDDRITRAEVLLSGQIGGLRSSLVGQLGEILHALKGAKLEKSVPAGDMQRSRYRVIGKVRHDWIEGYLMPSILDRTPLQMTFTEDSSKLSPAIAQHPFPRPPTQTRPEALAPTFRSKTTLVLGEPGGGKSTTILRVTDELSLAARADPDCQIPVIVQLSAWDGPHMAIGQWAVKYIAERYWIAPEIAQHWIESAQVHLMLDGLDELREDWRNACVEGINHLRRVCPELGLTVCCRSEEYDALSTRLEFDQALTLNPVTPEAVLEYVSSFGPGYQGLVARLCDDASAMRFASSPLILHILVSTWSEDGRRIDDEPTLRTEVFSSYVRRVFQTRPARWASAESHFAALRWLASNMKREGLIEFTIERVSAKWIPGSLSFYGQYAGGVMLWLAFPAALSCVVMLAMRQPALLMLLLVGLTLLMPVVAFFENSEAHAPFKLPWPWIALGALIGTGFAVYGHPAGPFRFHSNTTFLITSLAWPTLVWLSYIAFVIVRAAVKEGFTEDDRDIKVWLKLVPTLLWTSVAMSLLVALPAFGIRYLCTIWPTRFIAVTLFLACAGASLAALTQIHDQTQKCTDVSARSIHHSIRAAAFAWVGAFVFFFLFFVTIFSGTLSTLDDLRLVLALVWSLLAANIIAVGCGGASVLRQRICDLVLRQKKIVPYGLPAFLEDCVNQGLLRRVDRVYIFHPLVLAYFAGRSDLPTP